MRRYVDQEVMVDEGMHQRHRCCVVHLPTLLRDMQLRAEQQSHCAQQHEVANRDRHHRGKVRDRDRFPQPPQSNRDE